MTARGGDLDRLVGMEAAWGGEDADAEVLPFEEPAQRPTSDRPRRLRRSGQGRGVGIAYRDELCAIRVLLQRVEMVSGNPPTTDDGEANPAIPDRGCWHERP